MDAGSAQPSAPTWLPAEPLEAGVSTYFRDPDPGGHPERDSLLGHGGLLRIARQGTVFTHFYASSALCLPTRAAIVSGKAGTWTGATDNGFSKRLDRNPVRSPGANFTWSLPRLLRESGYVTGLIGKWHATGNPSAARGKAFGDASAGETDPWVRRNGDTCEDGFDEAIYYDRAYRFYFKRGKMRCACARDGCDPAPRGPCPCDARGDPGSEASPWAIWGDDQPEPPQAGAPPPREQPYFVAAGAGGLVETCAYQSRVLGAAANCDAAMAAGVPTHLVNADAATLGAIRCGQRRAPRGIAPDSIGCPYSVRAYADLAVDFVRRHGTARCQGDPEQACTADAECGAAGPCEQPPPFLLIVSFTAVHDGHRAPARTRAHYGTLGRGNAGRSSAYWGLLEETDAAIGRILDELDQTMSAGGPLADRTLVAFTSDQGPDGPELQFGTPKLRAGKATLFDGGIRVPTLVRACAQSEARVVTRLASHVDLLPTFLEAAGVPRPTPAPGSDSEAPDGRSWYGELTSSQWPAPSPVVRDFAFAIFGKEAAVVSRPGLFDGSTPPGWYPLPAAAGVCAFVGEGGSGKGGTFGPSRGPSEPLVLCDPDNQSEGMDVCGDQSVECRVLGGRCTDQQRPNASPAERARCKTSADCASGETCDPEDSVETVQCNACVRARWKLKAGPAGIGAPGAGLFELASDPEESRNFIDPSDPLLVHLDAQAAVADVGRALGGVLGRWRCSCQDPPPAPLSDDVPGIAGGAGVPAGDWSGERLHCGARHDAVRCGPTWRGDDEGLYP